MDAVLRRLSLEDEIEWSDLYELSVELGKRGITDLHGTTYSDEE